MADRHEDDQPSLKIYTETNKFNCFGCNAGGDTIEFIQQKENLSKHKALVKASELIEAPSQPSLRGKELGTANKEMPVVKGNEPNHTEILTKIFSYYKNGLHSGVARKPKE